MIFLKTFFPFEKIDSMKEKGKEESFFKSINEFVENIILTCNDHCLICGKKVKYPGLKPTVCLKKLCLFTHEQFGLGVDLETEIVDRGDIVDLLITFAYSAALNNINTNFDTFTPFPSGVEVKTKNKKGKEVTYDFMNGEKNDHQKCADLINKIPEIKKLQDWIEKGKFKEKCTEIDVLIIPFLRWLIASNRAHLKRLNEKNKIKEMNTPWQFLLLTSAPEKEVSFQDFKKNIHLYMHFMVLH